MRDRALDLDMYLADGVTPNPNYLDYKIANNDFVIVTDGDALRQRLVVKQRIFQGEWYLDDTFGLPFFQEIAVKNPDLSKISSVIKALIAATPEVLELVSFSLDYDAQLRTLRVNFSVNSTYGVIVVEQ